MRGIITDGECIQADFDDTGSLLEVLKGAHSVFLVTDFWATLSKETEVRHGINVADACGVRFTALSPSVPLYIHPKKNPPKKKP